MKNGRISQTALKVALGMITLSVKGDWAQRLPPGLVELSERLLLASGSPGYGPRLMRASKKQWMVRVYEIQDLLIPGQWEGFGYRKIFIQEQVERAIKDGAQQVLVLGAGFDTLSLRLAPDRPDVLFFEIDHPATSAAKAAGIADVGPRENLIQIPADLGELTLSNVLSSESRWDGSKRSVVLAEGLLQYLEDEEVRQLLGEAARCTGPGSRIVFTHAIPDELKFVHVMLRLVGEPFRSAVSSEDLPKYVEGTGWTVTSEVDTDPAHAMERYAVADRL